VGQDRLSVKLAPARGRLGTPAGVGASLSLGRLPDAERLAFQLHPRLGPLGEGMGGLGQPDRDCGDPRGRCLEEPGTQERMAAVGLLYGVQVGLAGEPVLFGVPSCGTPYPVVAL
jgi:hypothetical protein